METLLTEIVDASRIAAIAETVNAQYKVLGTRSEIYCRKSDVKWVELALDEALVEIDNFDDDESRVIAIENAEKMRSDWDKKQARRIARQANK